MDDPFPGLEFDPEALDRIRRSCELLGCRNGDTVLDVGCYRQAAKQFLPSVKYFGLDCHKFAEGTIVRDLENGFLWDSKVPRILCLEVLEHLKTPSRVLWSIQNALTDDGVAVISLPNEATLFHRIRSLLGVPDAEAFSEWGKHLHLPNLKQCRSLLGAYFEIVEEHYYVSVGHSRQRLLSKLLSKFPKSLLGWFARFCPSLFARGFIFKCRLKKRR